MRTKSERMIERARKEFRFGKSDELHIVKQIIRAGSEESERGDLFRQVSRILGEDRHRPERNPAVIR